MKALRLDGSKADARRVARCLIGSPTDDGLKLLGVDDDSDNPFIVQWPDIHGCNGHAEETLPIDTLVFDPFAAMREGVDVKIDGSRVTTWWVENCYKITNTPSDFRISFLPIDTIVIPRKIKYTSDISAITLDIEAACRLDGVEVVEV